MTPRVSSVWTWLLAAGLLISQAHAGDPAADPVSRIEHHGGFVRRLQRDGDALDVDLSGSTVADADLADLVHLKNVQVLRLKACRIGDEGLEHVARIMTLRRLFLDGTGVTDAGMLRLAPLEQLEFLNLYGTAVGDAGLAHIGRLPALKTVIVTAARVTPGGVSAFRDDNPDVHVIPDPVRQRQRTAAALEVATAAVAQAERELEHARTREAEVSPTVPGLKAEAEAAEAHAAAAKKQLEEDRRLAAEAGKQATVLADSVLRLRTQVADAPADDPTRKQLEEQSRLADAAAGEAATLRQRADQAAAASERAQKEAKERQQRFRNAEGAKRAVDAAQQRLDASRLSAEYIRGEALKDDPGSTPPLRP